MKWVTFREPKRRDIRLRYF